MDPATPTPEATSAPSPTGTLAALEARVLGCLIEKELATPDAYPLTLNALVNACNQRSNRDPAMEVAAREVEAALEQLRQKRLATLFSGADARGPKFKQKIDAVYPMTPAARAVLGELLLRGPQTSAGLRSNSERMHVMPPVEEFESLLAELTQRPAGALARLLPRQPGRKEARWAQLLTGEPAVAKQGGATPAGAEAMADRPSSGSATRLRSDEPRPGTAGGEALAATVTLPSDVERRLAALEAEVVHLRAELARLRGSPGEG
jgi:uncharacterized protein YceH (UPF0502 family)